MHEKKLQQELERQKEEDELKRKVKRPKQGPVKEEPLTKKSQTVNRQVATFSCSLTRGRTERAATAAQSSTFPVHKIDLILFGFCGRAEGRREDCQHLSKADCVPRALAALYVILSFWPPFHPVRFRDMNPVWGCERQSRRSRTSPIYV